MVESFPTRVTALREMIRRARERGLTPKEEGSLTGLSQALQDLLSQDKLDKDAPSIESTCRRAH
jgi:hypothetical protein